MKKIIIGRNNACDIIIPDTTDLVSRKQAVLTISFWGKMLLHDTSNNGTYVNGQKIESGKGVKVSRKDKVSFAKVADLDWNEVPDPYRKAKLWTLLGALLLALVIGGVVWWILHQRAEETQTKQNVNIEMPATKGETISTLDTPSTAAPVEAAKPQAKPAPRAKHQPVTPKTNNQGKSKNNQNAPKNGKEVLDRDVDDKTPIVY